MYRWISCYDGAADRRISDWERAEECARCGRRIVHVYDVEHGDGRVERVGRECAHRAMGWAMPRPQVLDRLRREALAAEERALEEAEGWDRTGRRRGATTAELAAADFYVRNRPAPLPLAVMTKGNLFYACCADSAQEEALRMAGWSRAGEATS